MPSSIRRLEINCGENQSLEKDRQGLQLLLLPDPWGLEPDRGSEHRYLDGLVKLAGRKIQTIYAGHDEPLTSNVRETILNTLANVRNSKIAPVNAALRDVA